MAEHIVSIGLLTQHDLNILGEGFNRHFPVQDDHPFSDLIAMLDALGADEEDDQIADGSHQDED